jgi:rhodanese-related sulfurtransferase
MARGFAAQRAHLTPVESRPPVNRETHTVPGQFLGDLSAAQVWQNLQHEVDAVLVDIRTHAEWTFVGGPDLATLGKSVLQVEWQVFPNMERNPRFVRELQAKNVTPGMPVYLICRSGIRSRAAAEFLAERGYTTYNVTDGFEGPINDHGHRGASGWRAERLPWKQS